MIFIITDNRTVSSHSACIWTLIIVIKLFIILWVDKRQKIFSVKQTNEWNFFSFLIFFNQNFFWSLLKFSCQKLFEFIFCNFNIFTNKNTFALAQPISFQNNFCLVIFFYKLNKFCVNIFFWIYYFKRTCGYVVFFHKFFCKYFAWFKSWKMFVCANCRNFIRI